jgi:hypothetical protein
MARQLEQFINRSFNLNNCHNRDGAEENGKEKEMRIIGSDSVQLCAA